MRFLAVIIFCVVQKFGFCQVADTANIERLDTVNNSLNTKKNIENEIGIASYYAKRFEGRKCSNGSIFRHDSLTAAHKSLPFGTIVKLTNLKNDSVVVVKITDRLPKKSKRTIDLTLRAAKQLNFLRSGLTKVTLEILN